MSRTQRCPRCGQYTFERLGSHAHCPCCLYFEDYWKDTEGMYFDALKALSLTVDPIEIVQEKKEEDVNVETQESA